MPRIHELLDRDPRDSALANKGQARIDSSEAGDETLRAELETFVCHGRFLDGLRRILERFLAGLDGAQQEAAWVSGFFGSGKSHLLKVLAHLWADTSFPDGVTARALVPGGLPEEITAALTELDARARRMKKRPAMAAGTLLSGNERVRSAVLSIILRSRDLPSVAPQARFVFWLREQGRLDPVRREVEATGKSWKGELNNFAVSSRIAEALLREIPDFAPGPKEVRKLLAAQFPPLTADLTTEEFVRDARKALAADGDIPPTVLVLDEAQQYIGESGDRSAVFTEVAEAIQTRFAGRVALVASGQSSLASTAALQKMRDRFRIHFELTDADVEVVTRRVLLAKKPSALPAIGKMFDASEGEVSRHLKETALATRSDDRKTRVEDYPLLSTRRRVWEACFRAVDAGGSHSQLRSQLRILHDSLCAVADCELGRVIPTSDLFHAVAPDLVASGVLPNEINTRIQKLADGSGPGALRFDLAGLVFLIGKLPRETQVDAGVRADAGTLADLLVSDLSTDSGPFRRRVAEELETLAGDQVLARVGTEYRLQTNEGAAWDEDFRREEAAFRRDDAAAEGARDRLLDAALRRVVSDLKIAHGESKVRRKLAPHAGFDPPSSSGGDVPVWLRDGWQCSRKTFEADARGAGTADPTLHVYVPRRQADALGACIAEASAARRVLELHTSPNSPEGRDAKTAMEHRLSDAETRRDAIVGALLRDARVLQGGGTEVVALGVLAEKLREGAKKSLARLFPRFGEGDSAHWGAALKRARDGNDHPFKTLGWDQDASEHPVAKELLGQPDRPEHGHALRTRFAAPPFGWSRDAVDAALIALHRTGRLTATRNGRPVDPGQLGQQGIKATTFRREAFVLGTTERIALRGLFAKRGVSVDPGGEARGAADFIEAMRDLAANASGPRPLPAPPRSQILDRLGQMTGNEQLQEIHNHREALEQLGAEWAKQAERSAGRRAAWNLATALHRHASGLPVGDQTGPELDAIRDQRSLLGEMDRMAPLIQKLSAALREELSGVHSSLEEAIGQAGDALAADPVWSALDPEKQRGIRRGNNLEPPHPLDVATDEALRRALDGRSLAAWRAEVDAVPTRLERALTEVAKPAPPKPDDATDPPRTPTPVTLRRATLADEAAVRAWVQETEASLLAGIRSGRSWSSSRTPARSKSDANLQPVYQSFVGLRGRVQAAEESAARTAVLPFPRLFGAEGRPD